MKLIYRGDQAKIISELSHIFGNNPTEVVYKLAKNMHELLTTTPIDALAAQEIINGRDKKE